MPGDFVLMMGLASFLLSTPTSLALTYKITIGNAHHAHYIPTESLSICMHGKRNSVGNPYKLRKRQNTIELHIVKYTILTRHSFILSGIFTISASEWIKRDLYHSAENIFHPCQLLSINGLQRNDEELQVDKCEQGINYASNIDHPQLIRYWEEARHKEDGFRCNDVDCFGIFSPGKRNTVGSWYRSDL